MGDGAGDPENTSGRHGGVADRYSDDALDTERVHSGTGTYPDLRTPGRSQGNHQTEKNMGAHCSGIVTKKKEDACVSAISFPKVRKSG